MPRLPTRSERRKIGERARTRVPVSLHAEWKPASERPDPVALLEEQAKSRIPDLRPVRYGRMLVSPLTFYRGAALPMAADLAGTPVSGITVQLAGDAHLSNFGLFASPERNLLFDINDFDETLPGPWEWDVKRLAASIAVAERVRGFDAHARHAVHATVASYRERMAQYAGMLAVDVHHARVDEATVLEYVDKRARPYLEATVRSAVHHDALHALPKLTAVDPSGNRRIIDDPPLIVHHREMTLTMEEETLARYRASLQEHGRLLLDRYGLIDAALKVVGVGSVGLGAWVALFDAGGGDDPLFLQVKEAQASILERYLGPSDAPTPGQRVVAGQRRLQAASDELLGWTVGPQGRTLYGRQLQDEKGSAVIDAMSLDDLLTWGTLCGWALARGHARTGDPVAIDAYLGTDSAFDHAVADFAASYADQTERDHSGLAAAVKTGRIPAVSGV